MAVRTLYLAVAFFSVACAGEQGAPAEGGGADGPAGQGPEESFTESDYGEVVSDPDAHRGARVDVVGRVFERPEKTTDGQTAFQMWADPENNDWNTVVVTDEDVSLEVDDHVRVRGEVVGSFEGENAFGASIVAPQIEASSVGHVDAAEALDPAKETIGGGITATDPAGFTVAVEKIELGEETTRVYVSARNDTGYLARFYASFDSRIVQGSKQIDPDTTSSYEFGLPEPQSELSPGVQTEGVVVYGPISPTEPFELRFKWTSENYAITPSELTFSVGG